MTRLAVRALAGVVVLGVALVIVLLGFDLIARPGLGGRTGDVVALAMFALPVGGLAAPIAIKPTVNRAILWVTASWIATPVYWAFVKYSELRDPTYEGAMRVMSMIAVTLPLVGAFSLHGAALAREPEQPILAHRLRSLFRLMLGIAAVISVIAFLPGLAMYDDANHCRDLPHCEPAYTVLAHSWSAGGPFVLAFLLVVLAPIGLAYRVPERRPLRAWIAWICLGPLLIGMLSLGIAYHGSQRVRFETLWPQHVVLLGLGVLAVLLLAVLPLVLATTREDSVPRARIAEGS